MKKLSFFLIALLFGITVFCMAPSGEAAGMSLSEQAKAVQVLEEALLTVPGDGDTLDTRVSRLEQTVFGQPQKGATLESRIARLQKVITTTRQASQTPSPSVPATGSMRNGMPSAPVSSTGPPASATYAGPLPGHPKRTAAGTPSSAPAYPQIYPNGGYPQSPPQTMSNNSPVRTDGGASASPAPDETDYPTVGQMEQQVFGRTYVKEDITVRLARLEKHVFKLVQTGSLADRVDNLRLVVLGDVAPSGAASASAAGPTGPNGLSYYYTPSPYPSANPGGAASLPAPSTYAPPGAYPGGGGYGYSPQAQQAYGGQPYYAPSGYAPSGGNAPGSMSSTGSSAGGGAIPSDLPAAIAQVEKDVLGKTYPTEAVNTRLDRLETKVFHTTSPELSNEDRMQRIIAVASAGGAPESGKTKAKHTIQALLPIILTILPMVLL